MYHTQKEKREEKLAFVKTKSLRLCQQVEEKSLRNVQMITHWNKDISISIYGVKLGANRG